MLDEDIVTIIAENKKIKFRRDFFRKHFSIPIFNTMSRIIVINNIVETMIDIEMTLLRMALFKFLEEI